jgi:hypothetical protein
VRPRDQPDRARRGDWRGVDLPIAKYTGTAAFPVFSPPAAANARTPDVLQTLGIRTVLAAHSSAPNTASPAARAGVDGIRIPVSYHPKMFARFIAKIAHGYAVAFLGPDSFEPSLVPSILGTSDEVGRWVGSPSGSMFDQNDIQGHRIRVGIDSSGQAVIAAIQLFADSGAPEYFVIAGRAVPGQN